MLIQLEAAKGVGIPETLVFHIIETATHRQKSWPSLLETWVGSIRLGPCSQCLHPGIDDFLRRVSHRYPTQRQLEETDSPRVKCLTVASSYPQKWHLIVYPYRARGAIIATLAVFITLWFHLQIVAQILRPRNQINVQCELMYIEIPSSIKLVPSELCRGRSLPRALVVFTPRVSSSSQ